jgi:peptidoglycan/LPS O-acetylase OafA/YrhL
VPTDGSSQPPASSGSSASPREAYQRVKRTPELPAPEAVKMRMAPIAAIGTLLWAVALVLTQIFRDELADSGREWWAACALAGVIIGILGTAGMALADRKHFGGAKRNRS